MREYVKCKSCGFIMEKGKLRDKCPACGVPAKMFEPYQEKISEMRKMILDSDIHPVIVHAPHAFAFFLFGLSIAALFLNGLLKDDVLAAMRVSAVCLPVFVLAAFCSGLFDGTVRFRRVTTPLLIRKMIFGSIFFVFSCVGFVVAMVSGFHSAASIYLILAVSFICFLASAVLGKIGSSLLGAKFPG